ncbi:hypothetical protein BC833DRAFT_623091 [Globomyces pollinis-pini]|nr:hypothetical protein BC833DRAFT_623091 [Globomyces pollinis-pini]
MIPRLIGKKTSSHFVFEGDADESRLAEEAAHEDEPTCALDGIVDTEEADDIELAWEALDLARLIYAKSDKEDVRLVLRDVSVESGNFLVNVTRQFTQLGSNNSHSI